MTNAEYTELELYHFKRYKEIYDNLDNIQRRGHPYLKNYSIRLNMKDNTYFDLYFDDYDYLEMLMQLDRQLIDVRYQLL